MNFKGDDTIRVTSATGQIERRIKINRHIEAGYIHIPTAFNGNDAMVLVELMPLFEADSSGWDSCPVSIEKAETVTTDT